MIGKVIGNFKITDEIAAGGMGKVFAGVDLMLERQVAIKMLRPELAHDERFVARFRSEAVTLAKLYHPNIAMVHAFFREKDDFFLVMEFVRGWTLWEIAKAQGLLPLSLSIPLFRQALDGIGYAHKKDIIHRDIKPSNFILKDTGLLKVMDFGIARVLGSAHMTHTGNLLGTLEYISPEQIRGQEADVRSDIYSLGVLLYWLLTGREPFGSNSNYNLMKAHIEEIPPRPAHFIPNISIGLEQTVLRALAKEPDERFQTIDELSASLEASASEFAFQPQSLECLIETLQSGDSQLTESEMSFEQSRRSGVDPEESIVSGFNRLGTTHFSEELRKETSEIRVSKPLRRSRRNRYLGLFLLAVLIMVPADLYFFLPPQQDTLPPLLTPASLLDTTVEASVPDEHREDDIQSPEIEPKSLETSVPDEHREDDIQSPEIEPKSLETSVPDEHREDDIKSPEIEPKFLTKVRHAPEQPLFPPLQFQGPLEPMQEYEAASIPFIPLSGGLAPELLWESKTFKDTSKTRVETPHKSVSAKPKPKRKPKPKPKLKQKPKPKPKPKREAKSQSSKPDRGSGWVIKR